MSSPVRTIARAAVALALSALPSGAARSDGAPQGPTCAVDPDPAAELLRRFRDTVLAYRPGDGGAPETAARGHMRFLAREAERSLLPHHDLLRSHVRWALLRLPRERLPETSALEHLPVRQVAPQFIEELRSEESPLGMKLAFFGDPTRALWLLRDMATEDAKAREWLRHDLVLEGIAPARIVWANDDLDQPILAIVKRLDIFQVAFAYDAASESYLPREITWVKRSAPAARPAASGADPAAAVLQEFADAVEAYDPQGSGDRGSSFTVAANAFAIEHANRSFAARGDALRAHARCELLKLPVRALPDTRSWRHVSRGAESAPQPRVLALLPLNRWEPRRLFSTLRSQTLWAGEGTTPAVGRRGELDLVAPPVLARTNDDLDNPVLAIADPDEVFTVALHYDANLPGYIAGDIAWLRRGP